ncbi:MAG: Ig-like domain-containing protein [Candidatus Njordarchaeales archaeon]
MSRKWFISMLFCALILISSVAIFSNDHSTWSSKQGLKIVEREKLLTNYSNENVSTQQLIPKSASLSSVQGRNNTIDLYNGSISVNWLIGPAKRISSIATSGNIIILGTDKIVSAMRFDNKVLWRTFSGEIKEIRCFDINNDGVEEIVASDLNGNLLYINASNGEVLRNITFNTKILSFSEANLDNDGALEVAILLANNTIVMLDYDKVLWKKQYSLNITLLYSSDIDYDGFSEVVLASMSGTVLVVKNGLDLWSYYINEPISQISTGNVTSDAGEEILCGTQLGDLYVLASSDGHLIRRLSLNEEISQVFVSDIDNNGQNEIIVGTLNGYVYLLDSNFSIVNSISLAKPITKIVTCQLDTDLQKEFIVATNEIIIALETDLVTLWQFSQVANQLVTTDYDSDGLDECVFSYYGNPYLGILESSGTLAKTLLVGFNSSYHLINDLDNDGLIEYVLAAPSGDLLVSESDLTDITLIHLGNPITYLFGDDIDGDNIYEYLIGLANGTILSCRYPSQKIWQITLSSPSQVMTIADVLQDTGKEIIVGTSSSIAIINSTGFQKLLLIGVNVTALVTGDDDGDSVVEIFAGLNNGSLIVLSPDGSIEASLKVGNGEVTAVSLADINGDNNPEILGGTSLSDISIIYARSSVSTTSLNQGKIVRIYPHYQASGVIAVVSSNGVSLLNASTLEIINQRSFSNPITDGFVVNWKGGNDYQIAIIFERGSVALLIENLTITNTYGESLHSSYASIMDNDNDVVSEIFVSSSYGLRIIDPVPEIWVTYPENNSVFAQKLVTLRWDIFGLVPSYFEIYLNNLLKCTLNASTRNHDLLLSNGSWYITIRVVPVSGLAKETMILVTVDEEIPKVTITQPLNNTITNETSITIRWSGTDEYSGIHHYELSIDNGSWINVGSNTSYTAENLSYGQHIICVKAIDHAGNVNISSIYIIIDYVPPEIMIISPTNNSYLATSEVNISWSYSEDHIDHFEIIVDNTTRYNVGSNTSLLLENLSEGEHVVRIIGYDKAMNRNEIKIVFIIDTVEPEIDIVTPANGTYLNASRVEIEWRLTEQNLKNITIAMNDTVIVTITDENVTSYTIELSDGIYEITLVAYDRAGNQDIAQVIVYIDTKAPSLDILTPINSSYYNASTIRIEWVCKDSLSGLKEVWLRIDGEAWILLDGNISLSGLSDGSHFLEIIAIDKAGNRVTKHVIFFIDTEIPRVEILSPRNNTYTNQSLIIIKWSCYDKSLSSILLRINGSSWINVTGSNEYVLGNLSEGRYIIELLAIDKAGNIGSTLVVITIDYTPPEIRIIGLRNNTVLSNDSVIIRWVISDRSPVVKVLIRLDNGSWQVIGRNYYIIDLTELLEGKHRLEIMAIDTAGNKGVTAVYFEIVSEEIIQKPSVTPYLIGLVVLIGVLAALNIKIYLSKKRPVKEAT